MACLLWIISIGSFNGCRSLSLSLLSIVSDDDISVGVRPLRALLVGERIVQFEI